MSDWSLVTDVTTLSCSEQRHSCADSGGMSPGRVRHTASVGGRGRRACVVLRQTGWPAASACTASVVRHWPPMAQSPLLTSSITHHVTWRKFSPSMLTIASVKRSAISDFWVIGEDAFDDLDVDEGHVSLLACWPAPTL